MTEHTGARVCHLCSVVKPDEHSFRDHMRNVHPQEFQSWAVPLHAVTTDTTEVSHGGFSIMCGCHVCGWVWAAESYPSTPEWAALGIGHAMANEHEAKMNGKVVTS